MGILWNQLQPIQAPQVVAQLPQQANQTDAGVSGLMSGIAQGQQMQMNQMQLNQAKQAQADQQELRGAGTMDNYVNILQKQGRFEDAQRALYTVEQTRGQLLNNKKSLIDLDKTERAQAIDSMSLSVPLLMGTINQQDPQQRQEFYQKHVNEVNKYLPENNKLPTTYDEATVVGKLEGFKLIQDSMQQEQTESVKTTVQLFKLREDLENQKRLFESQGRPTNAVDSQLASVNAQIKDHTKENSQDSFQQSNKLRDDFNNLTKDFRLVSDSYRRIQASVENPSPAGDMALIFNYMKMLDPGSTVREGEYATAKNAASLPESLRASYNKLINGETLTESQRKDFMGRAGKLYKSQKQGYDKNKETYSERAKRQGLDPRDVIDEYDIAQPPEQQPMQQQENVDYDAMAQEAIAKGADPKAVAARLQQLKGKK